MATFSLSIEKAMNTIIFASSIRYESNGWRVTVESLASGSRFIIESINTGGFEFESGTNLDQLATLIVDAKADAISRGINWSGN
jgi:hypothetical protein